MRVWRLTARRHAGNVLDGEGAATFGGRWNPVGVRMVYTADSLALATLELAVHLVGANAAYTAVELDIAARSVDVLDAADLKRSWRTDLTATQRIGASWSRSASASLALSVPSALVDPRSGERNVILNPAHAGIARVREVQRFDVQLDERL